jgi:hypothetical protein
MANFFKQFPKFPLLDSPALFFCRQVAKIRHKKKTLVLQVQMVFNVPEHQFSSSSGTT